MKYTFEISISGCTTNCAHCYVDGGPASQMNLQDYRCCARRIKSILEKLDGDIAVTLGNEPFCHSAINEILSFTSEVLSDYFSFQSYPVPTTGIALMAHKDRDKIIENLKNVGARGFMLALHGAEYAHDEMVQKSHAFSALFTAANYFASQGFELLFNLIVSKALCSDFDRVMNAVSIYPNARIALTVPLYVPTARMRRYQIHRAEYSDCMNLANQADSYALNTVSLRKHCTKHCEAAVINNLNTLGFHYAIEKTKTVAWKFFNVTQNGDLYYGNVGAHTKHLGNLFHTDESELLEEILVCKPNYDYTAYYPDDVFWDLEKYVAQLSPRRHNYVYSSQQDCIYALLDELGVKNAFV